MSAPDEGLRAHPERLSIIGPFEYHAVIVNGHAVPLLTATPMNGGMIDVTLDRRFSVDMTVEEAERFLPFIADCMAVAAGYTCHPSPECPEPQRKTPFPRMGPLYFETGPDE